MSQSTHEIQLLSINAAEPQPLQVGNRHTRTGHFKQPLQGIVAIEETGIDGDFIADLKHHGGPDQALYLYSQEDIDWWKQQLQRDISPGFFGENLTVSHWWPTLRIGDRLQAGELLLEITAPRIPCSTLAARVGDKLFPKAFVKAERCGAYARVLQPGTLQAGQTFTVLKADVIYPTINEVYRYCHSKGHNLDFVQRVLHSPVAEKMRVEMEERKARAELATGQLPGI
ncbi:MAG TPA: MOSC domain-containing protein [Pseudomonas sabulinigri]|uniref:MOSC domain-containing protein n=1 Tax=marine sediment metagenome TaxID=412755 RepID=A0A0F9U3G7_9ZZZZ|nr:MOSC domain-containing protein [Halopseudomonas sabulinigri]HEC51415.1 MOSC domain-containing protein [Halopseudomonas sabulinigri]|tara:strand:- start:20 stop:703 length:684 start_codon:yes stop_codon:yes gene_type:complete